ncbi:MAG: hypothetical protein WCP69_00780 [Bacteroidota bacterium]
MQKRFLLLILIVVFNFVQNFAAISCKNESKIYPSESAILSNTSSIFASQGIANDFDNPYLADKKQNNAVAQNEQTSLLESFVVKLRANAVLSKKNAIYILIENLNPNSHNKMCYLCCNEANFLINCVIRI